MTVLMAIAVGGLFAAAFYMMMRRSIVKLVIGLGLLSNAANLLILTAGGLTRGAPPLIAVGANQPPIQAADPLPQALVLTAIVIAFGVLSFAVVLIHRAHQVVGTDDLAQMRSTDA